MVGRVDLVRDGLEYFSFNLRCDRYFKLTRSSSSGGIIRLSRVELLARFGVVDAVGRYLHSFGRRAELGLLLSTIQQLIAAHKLRVDLQMIMMMMLLAHELLSLL